MVSNNEINGLEILMQYDSKAHIQVPDKYVSNTNSNAYISV